MDVGLAIAAGVERGLHQVFLHRCAGAVLVLVEQKQALGQLAVVESLGVEHIGHHSLVVALGNQVLGARIVVGVAFLAQCLAERKLLDVVKEGLLKLGLGCIVVGAEEGEHVLEHAAGSARCGHKLHHLVALTLVVLPCLLGLFLGGCVGCDDALANGSSGLDLQKRKTFLVLYELSLHLFHGHAAALNLFLVCFCKHCA